MMSPREGEPGEIMKTRQTILLILVLVVCTACATSTRKAPGGTRTALDVVKLRQPNTQWSSQSLVEGDLDQDGRPDYAVSGIRKDRFVVGIVEGPVSAGSKTWFLDFPWKGGGQEALCSDKAKMTLEPLDPAAKAGERKAATSSKAGLGINLHDDLCDAFHIYWDPSRKTFDWWRL
jgi:hypothetical protein